MEVPELRSLPRDWSVETVDGVACKHKGAIKIGPFGSQLKRIDMIAEGYKVYGQENVYQKDFSLGERFIPQQKFQQLRSCVLNAGDVVITMMGTIGAAAVVPDGIAPGVMDSHLLRITPDPGVVHDQFLALLLASYCCDGYSPR